MTSVLDDYLTESETANQLKRCTATLARWRRLREGPAFVRIGRSIYYKRTTIADWLTSREAAETNLRAKVAGNVGAPIRRAHP